MAQIRLKGIEQGENMGTVSATVGADSDSVAIPAFRFPSAFSVAVPRISDAFDDETFTLDETGLTNITARQWSVVGGADLGTGATQPGTGLGGDYIQCVVTCDQGVLTSPPIRVYESTMMGETMDAGHRLDDAALLTIVPHVDTTHIAIADGRWTDPSIWHTGNVPSNGATVLIPSGSALIYDNEVANIRLDRVRVDGRLWVDTANLTDEQITMLVETIVVTRGGDFEVGTTANRVPAAASVEFIISGEDYSSKSYTPTDLKVTRFEDARGWERGFVVQGRRSFWGAEKLTWSHADPIDAGATSLTLHKAPVGWSVGDTIVIGGTKITQSGGGLEENPHSAIMEDEERVITGIAGNVVSWTDGLVYPHKNQLVGSTRTDLYPVVMAKGNKNITIRSEVLEPVWRRGHDVQMHHHTTVDLWDAQFIDLGRTDKGRNTGNIKNTNQIWGVPLEVNSYNVELRPLDNRSNLQSRYSIHLHHVGFGHAEDARPIVSNCYVEGSLGWAVVHHSCDADFKNVAIHKFYGCGMVSEQGNELGAWVDCLALGTIFDSYAIPEISREGRSLPTNPKVADIHGNKGDGFAKGYGFGFRGRAMRTNRCVANSVAWGYVFFHRGGENPDVDVTPVKPLDRRYIDIKDVAIIKEGGGSKPLFNMAHYPIIHFADNECIAAFGGFFVTKAGSPQIHDTNIKLKRLKAWGIDGIGAFVEYIGTYILDQFDLVSSVAGEGQGLISGANAYQVAFVNPRVEGFEFGITFGSGANLTHDQDDPRWMLLGMDAVDVDTVKDFDTGGGTTGNPDLTVLREIDDFDGTFITYDQDPSESFPLIMGTMNFDGSVWDSIATNADGAKTDNLSSTAELCPKKWNDDVIRNENTYSCFKYSQQKGHYTYNGGEVIRYTDLISDRLTARPHKITKLKSSPVGVIWVGTENGPFTIAGSPVSVSDVTAVVAKNGTVDIDVLTDASPSGGDGVTYELDTRDSIKADNGRSIITAADGVVRYTPDRNHIGTDEFYVFVKSENRFGTVRVNTLVNDSGTDGGITTPVVDTHFTATDAPEANTIDLELLSRPDTSNRRIERTFYSTDAGATWRRLCHGWPQAVHKVTVESDGTAISNGSYNVRIRYSTDFDYVTSTASGDDTVTVA